MKTMICPLCGRGMKANYVTLHDGPIKGYQEIHSCATCRAVVTVNVQQHDELYEVVNPAAKGEE